MFDQQTWWAYGMDDFGTLANSAEADKTPQNDASDQVQRCLPRTEQSLFGFVTISCLQDTS